MRTNEVPVSDRASSPTGCCPKFQPAAWDGQELDFDHKPFVKAGTKSLFHVPLDMDKVFTKTIARIDAARAADKTFFVLSHDDSPWHAEHYFAVDKPVPDTEMVELSGRFLTRVFEGPYSEMGDWAKEMQRVARTKERTIDDLFFFYATCPKCAKRYGKNYVVGVAKVH